MFNKKIETLIRSRGLRVTSAKRRQKSLPHVPIELLRLPSLVAAFQDLKELWNPLLSALGEICIQVAF